MLLRKTVIRNNVIMNFVIRNFDIRNLVPVPLEETDPAGFDFVRDRRSMPPALTDHTTVLAR